MKVKKVPNKRTLVVQSSDPHKNVRDDPLVSPPYMDSLSPDTSAGPAIATLHSPPPQSSNNCAEESLNDMPDLRNLADCGQSNATVEMTPPFLQQLSNNFFGVQQPLQTNQLFVDQRETVVTHECNAVHNEVNTLDIEPQGVANASTVDNNVNLDQTVPNESLDYSDPELQKLLDEFIDDPTLENLSQYLPPEPHPTSIALTLPVIAPSVPNITSTAQTDVNGITHSNVILNHQNQSNLRPNDLSSSIVSIDLNEDSSSPKPNTLSNDSPAVTAGYSGGSHSTTVIRRRDSTDSDPMPHPMAVNASLLRSQLNAKPVPNHFHYCAKDYRIFNLTRTSNRNKSSTQSEDYNYELLKNISWAECDGSQYEAKVKKWSEDEMSEDRRKEILRSVQDDDETKFVKSVYKADRNVFYWWTAFKGESFLDRNSRKAELKCIMRLDTNAEKGERFAKYDTRLFVLVGTVYLTVENGKQRKTVDVGHEILVPSHTKFKLENKSPDECYLYCIVSN